LCFGETPILAQTADEAYRFARQRPSTGTRATGMGGVGSAGWADPSALSTNPAGLGYYTDSEVSGGLNTLLSRDKSTYQIFADGPASRQTEKISTIQRGHLTGIYHMPTSSGSFVLALGLKRTAAFDRHLQYEGINSASSISDTFLPAETNGEYKITTRGINIFPVVPYVAFQAGAIEFFESRYLDGKYPFLQAVAPGRRIRQRGSVAHDGTRNEFRLAGAIQVASNIIFGGGVNISTGKYGVQHELRESDLKGNDNYSVVTENGLLEDFQSMLYRTRSTSKFTGVSLRGGLSARPLAHIRLGFTVETPMWHTVSKKFSAAVIQTTFSNGSLTYGDDADEDEARGQFDYHLNTPWQFGLGVSYHSTPLLVAANVEFADWSELMLSTDAASPEIENTNDTLQKTYGPVFNWRAGMEYRFENGLKLRIGGAYHPDARTFDISFADGSTEDRSRLFISAGAGFEFGDRFTVDIAWRQERTKDQFMPYPSVTPPTETQAIAVPLIDEDIVRNQFQISIRYSL